MKFREHVVFDIGEEKFKYLQREDNIISNRVDIVDLNNRLNRAKKISFYNNAKIITLLLLCLALVAMISLKV
jgi:hypothetical protein